MTEWTIVTVIVVLVGLFFTVATPIIQQTKTMTKLDATMQTLSDKLTEIESKNSDAHKRIWDHNAEQDKQLHGHEIRIVKLEDRIDK